jgi:hypothetical protein
MLWRAASAPVICTASKSRDPCFCRSNLGRIVGNSETAPNGVLGGTHTVGDALPSVRSGAINAPDAGEGAARPTLPQLPSGSAGL